MGCYIIRLPSDMDGSVLSDLGIYAQEKFSCVNCFVAELTPSQMKKLQSLGIKVTYDATCRI